MTTTLTDQLRALAAEWISLGGTQETFAQRTLTEAADDLLAIVNGMPDDERDAAPCDNEAHSWDHFSSKVVDSYWMRCHRLGPHDEHENGETGATWSGDPSA